MSWETLIGIIPTIILGFFTYNQYTKNKMTDYKIDKLREDNKKKEMLDNARLNSAIVNIISRLHRLGFLVDADRVSILQPHPLLNKGFLSISYEITNVHRDVTGQKDTFQNEPFAKWTRFVSILGTKDLQIWNDISLDAIKDPKIYSFFHLRGVRWAASQRMVDINGNWIGNILVSFTHTTPNEETIKKLKSLLSSKAVIIQDILPEYIPVC